MIKGLYTAASGMMLNQARQDVLANNLANVNTCGFKKDTVACTSFPGMLISRLEKQPDQPKPSITALGLLNSGAVVGAVATDFSVGNLRLTERPTDLALANDSYFAVETPNGERYTRNGQFQVTGEGLLTDQLGNPVLDDGDEQITLEGEFTVDKQGNITVNGETVATLKIVHFEDPKTLKKVGDNLMEATDGNAIDENPQVMQGYIEESNVNAVSEMVDLVKTTRMYESLQKMVQAENETLETAIEKVGTLK